MTDQSADSRPILGIDIGGSGIKGAPVDLTTGELITDRLKIATPAQSTPKNVAKVVGEIVDNFKDQIGDGPVGVTIPAVVTHGMTRSAANIDKSWIDCEAEKILEDHLGRDIMLVNDADAAGIAEVYYGAAKDQQGLVILTTLGTGIGTAIIYRGRAGAELRARPPGDRRVRRRDPGRLQRQGSRGPVLQGVGASDCSATTSGSRRCSGRT